MNEKLLSSISVMFLLIMNVVSAFELPNDGVYEMEQATFFEKVFWVYCLEDFPIFFRWQ